MVVIGSQDRKLSQGKYGGGYGDPLTKYVQKLVWASFILCMSLVV